MPRQLVRTRVELCVCQRLVAARDGNAVRNTPHLIFEQTMNTPAKGGWLPFGPAMEILLW
jgi:hypothetical protein